MKPSLSVKSELAIPFITYTQKQGFNLNPEAESFIRQIPENKKIAIISIVGKYRTGKSFFVNRVLLNSRKSGFQVGPTINPCTKGLWLWKKTLSSSNPEYDNMEILLIDTEGFGGMDQNTNHDSRIFLFSLLLSSYFIYNSVGSIDENALNTLNLIINLAKDIQTKTGGKQETLASHFPAFLWVVRDFTLQLVDKNGNKVTSKQYLQNALELLKGVSDSAENKNKVRRAFKHYFQDRDCFTMVRPTEDQRQLQRLDQIQNKQLRPQFLVQVEAIRKKIFTKVKPKTLNNKSLNGSMLAELIKGYTQAINKGALPNIQNAWVYVCRNEGMKALNQTVKNVQKKIQALLAINLKSPNNATPLQQKQIQELKQKWIQQGIKQFKQRSMGSQDAYPQFIINLKNKINTVVQQFRQTNKKNWEYKYREFSEKGIQKLKDKIFKDQYKNYNEFLEDFNNIKNEYEKQTGKGKSSQKWKFFNELAQNVHRLAAETITTKLNNTIQVQKQLLQQKISLKEQQFIEKKRQYQQQKQIMKNKIQDLQRFKAKVLGNQQYSQQRLKQLKQQRDRLREKCSQLQLNYQEKCFQLDRVTKEIDKSNWMQLDQMRSQLKILKSNMQKQKVLSEMEKSYHQKQITAYKQKILFLEGQNRKQKIAKQQQSQQLNRLTNILKEKDIDILELRQKNQIIQKRVQFLLAQDKKKNQLLKDQNQWLLQKSYLENQITFLRNTVNQNKRLHDALVVALQQQNSNSNESEKISQLMQTNKNLSLALQKQQSRTKAFQQKQQKLKKYKKIIKNSLAFQCINCSKLISYQIFSDHILGCADPNTSKLQKNTYNNTKQNSIQQQSQLIDNSNLNITISQTSMKQLQQNKPYTQYLIQVSFLSKKWAVARKFKNFCQLQQNLFNLFPSIKFPQSSNAIINVHTDINQIINSKRTLAVEERKKALQTFIRDLAKIDQIRNSKPFKEFLKLDEYIQQQNNFYMEQKMQSSIANSKAIYGGITAANIGEYDMGSTKKETPYKNIYSSSKHKKY